MKKILKIKFEINNYWNRIHVEKNVTLIIGFY